MARVLRPAHVVVVGSKAGFAPVCFAAAIRDNEGIGVKSVDCEETLLRRPGEIGALSFVDPSKSIHRDEENHSFGIGSWDEPDVTHAIFDRYGVADVVTHYKMTSEQFISSVSNGPIDLLYIDGDHSFDGIMHDMVAFHPRLSSSAMVLAHDVDPSLTDSDGYAVLQALPPDLYEYVRIPLTPGLAIMRPLQLEGAGD